MFEVNHISLQEYCLLSR